MDSVLQSEKECYVCKTTLGLHEHHIYAGSANRKKSEQFGMKVFLCGRHHNMSDEGVHFNKALDMKLKRLGQLWWVTHGRTTEEFIKEFGKSFI